MFIIWGLGKVTRRFYGSVMTRQCNHCNNHSGWQLCVARKWFTLFFIPIIPYSKSYCITCPHCGSYIEIDQQRFDQLLTAIQQGESETAKYAGKTPTQIQYLKDKEEEERRNQQSQQ